MFRAKSIPENATIRKEYIKCGKEMCELKHGPYYYAYWKDPESKKLKKKYIGDPIPKVKSCYYGIVYIFSCIRFKTIFIKSIWF
jgi:hypothetical protein